MTYTHKLKEHMTDVLHYNMTDMNNLVNETNHSLGYELIKWVDIKNIKLPKNLKAWFQITNSVTSFELEAIEKKSTSNIIANICSLFYIVCTTMILIMSYFNVLPARDMLRTFIIFTFVCAILTTFAFMIRHMTRYRGYSISDKGYTLYFMYYIDYPLAELKRLSDAGSELSALKKFISSDILSRTIYTGKIEHSDIHIDDIFDTVELPENYIDNSPKTGFYICGFAPETATNNILCGIIDIAQHYELASDVREAFKKYNLA